MADENASLIEQINRLAPDTVGKTFIAVDGNEWVITVAHPDDETIVFRTTDGSMTTALGSMVDRLKAAGIK